MDYTTYQAEDFAADEHFVRWVLTPTLEDTTFWENWQSKHPEKKEIIADARRIIQGLSLSPQLPDSERMAEMWQAIETRRQPVSPFRSVWFSKVRRWQVAASIATLFLLAAGYWFVMQPKLVETGYGEFRIIELPDKSLITLNSNSRLWYSRFWDNQKSREVWLDGEAFFDIRKKPKQGAYSQFIAHVGQSSVNVVGTQFNLKNRRGQIEVMLKEGRVNLKPDEQSAQAGIQMKPGDVASISPNAPPRLTHAQSSEQYMAWQERKLIFDDRSLGDVAQLLEDTYGVTIKFADPSLARLRLKGKVYAKDIENALDAISVSFDLQYVRDKDTVLIRRR